MNRYFGFLENKSTSGRNIRLSFDCVARNDYTPFLSLREISELHTYTISIEIPLHSKKHKPIRLLKQNRWHELYLSMDKGDLFCNITDPSGNTINNEFKIYIINKLQKRSKKNIELEQTFSLSRFTPSDKNSIKKTIEKTKNKSFVARVINVGQGNSIAATDIYCNKDIFYVDVGSGINQNKDINITPSFNPSDGAFVILTHWDKDHWVSAENNDSLKEIKWIVPRQEPIGASHIKLASHLHFKGNLILWPDDLRSIDDDIVDIYKLPKNNDRNLSGLVVVCKNEHWHLDPCKNECDNSKNLLITGDAPYKKCDFLHNYTLDALIIPHHGGSFAHEKYPKVKRGNCAILSCGKENTYGHPNHSTISSHLTNGWRVENTFEGDIYIRKDCYDKKCHSDTCAVFTLMIQISGLRVTYL